MISYPLFLPANGLTGQPAQPDFNRRVIPNEPSDMQDFILISIFDSDMIKSFGFFLTPNWLKR
jgi:hypothetical protein